MPILALILVGTLFAGLLVQSAASLNKAVEQAARCYAINVSECSSAATTQAYAQSHYYGLSQPAFTVSTAACGHQVSGTLTIAFDAAVTNWNVPLSATACYP
jgi:hypothetical protein